VITEKDLLELINIQLRARGFATISREVIESVGFSFNIFCDENNFDSVFSSEYNNFHLTVKHGNRCPTCDD